MGEEIFTFLRESKYSVSLITVPFCPVAPCPFQILAGVLESMRKDAFEFAKEKYLNVYQDTRSVQENFNLMSYFI